MQTCSNYVYIVAFLGVAFVGCSHEKLSGTAHQASRTLALVQSLTIESFEDVHASPQVHSVYSLGELLGTWIPVAAYCRKLDGRTAKEFSPSGLTDQTFNASGSYDEEKDGLHCEVPFSKVAVQKINEQTGADVHLFTFGMEGGEDRDRSGRYFTGVDPPVGKSFYSVGKLAQDPCFAFVYPTAHAVVVIRRQACAS